MNRLARLPVKERPRRQQNRQTRPIIIARPRRFGGMKGRKERRSGPAPDRQLGGPPVQPEQQPDNIQNEID
jgi:hypothetical protein